MRKVIRLNKKQYDSEKYNRLYAVNNRLAVAMGLVTSDFMPRRRAFRREIIEMNRLAHKMKKLDSEFKISHRDIKRLERPDKYEIPTHVVDILEIIVEELKDNKESFSFRAPAFNQDTISYYLLMNTIQMIRVFDSFISANEDRKKHDYMKYTEEVNYVQKRLAEFDAKYPGTFNSLF